MAKWTKTCGAFAYIREMLESGADTGEDCATILLLIGNCCEELTPDTAADWAFFDAYRDLMAEVREAADDLDEDDFEECENTVNYYLNELYDLSDNARVWLATQEVQA